jgi:putative ABC transport system permease protein
VLATGGGLAGLLLAVAFHRGLLLLVGDRIPIPRLDQVAIDLPMMAFTIIMALATGIVFGLVPALASTGHREGLRDPGRHGGSLRLRRMLSGLVVVEVALSLVLVAGAGLLMRSLVKLQNVDTGFRIDGLLTAFVQLPSAPDDDKRARFFSAAVRAVSALPGAENAAALTCLPLAGSCIATGYWRLDRPAPPSGQVSSTQVRSVTPGSFRTLGIPQVGGRDFSETDTADSMPVAIVSESLARQHFPGENPIGRQLHINSVEDARGQIDNAWTVVGVVRDIKAVSLDADPGATVFVPHAQLPSGAMVLMVRAKNDPMALASSVTRVVRSLDASVLVSDVRTLAEFAGRTIARPRAISLLVAVFALIALVLASVGVYGVMAYCVVERTHEIGVRVALGASQTAVVRLVVGQAMQSVALGVIAGLVAAGALTRQLERLLFQIEPTDPWTFSLAAIVLVAIGAVASYLPARRGMRIAPVEALRPR